VVPMTVIFQVRQAGVPAVLAVDHVVRLAPGRGLVAAAGELAPLVPQRHQAAQVDGDAVGLAVVRVLYLLLATSTLTHRGLRYRSSGQRCTRGLAKLMGAAESVPAQLANAGKNAERRGRRVFSAIQKTTAIPRSRKSGDKFVNLIEAIEFLPGRIRPANVRKPSVRQHLDFTAGA
jgi:hypothetical protein